MPIDGKDNSAGGIVKQGTSTLGSAVGGITKTAGGVVGEAGRGVGSTVNKTTGTTQGGDALQGLTGGLEDGANKVGKGVEDAGEGKKSSW